MSDGPTLAEWEPDDGFNLVDYRDTGSDAVPPPYVLTFRFPEDVVVGGVVVDVVGWGVCGSTDLFSRVVISKNGKEAAYDGKLGSILTLQNPMKLTPDRDNVRITLFPACPAHMARVNRVAFLSSSTTPPPKTKSKTQPQSQPANPQPQPPLPHFNDYWYLYATAFSMFVVFMLSLLFMQMHNKK